MEESKCEPRGSSPHSALDCRGSIQATPLRLPLTAREQGAVELSDLGAPELSLENEREEEDKEDGDHPSLDLELARRHGRNSRISRRTLGAQPCPCGECEFKDAGAPFSFGCAAEDLAPLGAGWVLFFDFTKFVVLLLLFFQLMYLGILTNNWNIDDGRERLIAFTWLFDRARHNETEPFDIGGFAHVENLTQAVDFRLGTAGNWGPAMDLFPESVQRFVGADDASGHHVRSEAWAREPGAFASSASALVDAAASALEPNAEASRRTLLLASSGSTTRAGNAESPGTQGAHIESLAASRDAATTTAQGVTVQVDDVRTVMYFPWVIYYHYVCLFGTVAALSFYRRHQVELVLRATERYVTASDYSVLLENLPQNCRHELRVIRMVHQVLGERDEDGNVEPHPEFDQDGCRPVVRVVFAFDIGRISEDLDSLHRKRAELKRRVEMRGTMTNYKQAKKWQEETKKLREEVLSTYGRVVEHLEESLNARAAIVTMRKPHMAEALIEALRMPSCERWLRMRLPHGCQSAVLPTRLGAMEDGAVVASRPPNPSDIIWEGYGPNVAKRFLNGWVAFFLSLTILVVLMVLMEKLTRHAKNLGNGQLLGMAVAGIVQVVNFLYPMLIERIVLLKSPKTRTEKRCAEMWRIAIFTIINTVVIGLYQHAQHFDVIASADDAEAICSHGLTRLFPVRHSDFGTVIGWPAWLPESRDEVADSDFGLCTDWYSPGHLVADTMNLLYSTIWLTPLLIAVSPGFVISKLRQWWYSCCANLVQSDMTQRQLNEVFEGPEPQLPYRYAHLLNVLTLALTFLPVIPITPGIAAVGLVLFYGANKYFLLRQAKRPYVQSHLIAFRALDLIWIIVLPQPTVMCLLLSPSVDNRKAMWLSVVPGTLTLAVACLLSRCYCLMQERRLIRQVRRSAQCGMKHDMDLLSLSEFRAKFGQGAERHDGIDNSCSWCWSDLGDCEEPQHVYNCPVCEGNGVPYHLCQECGMRERTSGLNKDVDQPYESAKRLFIFQYWKACPLYSLFEDYFPWQESDMDRAHSQQLAFETALRMKNTELLQKVLIGHARAIGLQVTKNGERKIRRYAAELADGERAVVLSSEGELEELLGLLDEDDVFASRRRFGAVLVGPGWRLAGERPQPGLVEASGGRAVVQVQRAEVTVVTAVQELMGEGWEAFQQMDEGIGEGIESIGAATPSSSSKRNDEVACDWETLASDPTFKALYGGASTECPRCAREFDSRELLIEHFNLTNHDVLV